MSKQVDVEKTLRSKKKGKHPSKLIVWLLKKIIHEDEINFFMEQCPVHSGIDFANYALNCLAVKAEIYGAEKLEKNKRYIFASNHPLGGLDGLSLIHLLGKELDGKLKFLANDILMTFKPLHDIALPINKHGAQGKHFAGQINNLFDSDDNILIFPAGACSRYQVGKGIYDLDWKKTFITRSIQHQRDVVPIYFEGRNSRFFYTLAFIRKNLGIKLNIEMLFLAHEMFGNKNKTFKAYIGEPIPWQHFDKKKSAHQWANEVKEIVYKLKTR